MSELVQRIRELAGRKSVKNGLWMYLLQAFNTIIPLLTLPYVTRILGAEGFGLFSIALNIIGYLQVLVEYGFGMSATRKVAVADTDHDLLQKTFSCVLVARLCLMAICVVISVGYALFSGFMSPQSVCLLIMTCALLGNCVEQSWLFQGLQNMKLISIINIVGRTVSTALIFILIKGPDDVYTYSLLYSVSPLIAGFVGLAVARRTYDLHFVRVTMGEVLGELRDGFYVFTTQLSAKVFGAAGVTMLGVMAPASVVGIYSAIQKVPNLIMLAWSPVSQVLYPISSKRLDEDFGAGVRFVLKIRRYALIVFGALCALVALLSRPIVEIGFGAEYADYHYWVIPLLGWLLVGINNNFLGIQILLGSGHDKEYSACFQVGVVATLACNAILIALFGGNGASVAPLFSELILTILLTRAVHKLTKTETRGQDNVSS